MCWVDGYNGPEKIDDLRSIEEVLIASGNGDLENLSNDDCRDRKANIGCLPDGTLLPGAVYTGMRF